MKTKIRLEQRSLRSWRRGLLLDTNISSPNLAPATPVYASGFFLHTPLGLESTYILHYKPFFFPVHRTARQTELRVMTRRNGTKCVNLFPLWKKRPWNSGSVLLSSERKGRIEKRKRKRKKQITPMSWCSRVVEWWSWSH